MCFRRSNMRNARFLTSSRCMAKSMKRTITTTTTTYTPNNAPPLPHRAALTRGVLRVVHLRLQPKSLPLEKCLVGIARCTAIYCYFLLLEIRVDSDWMALYISGTYSFLFPLVSFFVSL